MSHFRKAFRPVGLVWYMTDNHGKTLTKSELNSVENWASFWKKWGFWPTLTIKDVNGGLVPEQIAAKTALVLLECYDIINILFFASLLKVTKKTTGINELTFVKYVLAEKFYWMVGYFVLWWCVNNYGNTIE